MAKSDVRVGAPITGTGGILVAPQGTALPTDSTTAPDAALEKAGYVGEDGITMTQERSTEKIRAWGGDTVKVVQTEHDVTFSWQFLETNPIVLREVYGQDNVEVTPASPTAGTLTAVKLTSSTLPERVYVFEMKDGGARVRVVVPNLQITEVGDTTFVHSDVLRYEVTGEALPDENGVKAYIYEDNGVTAA